MFDRNFAKIVAPPSNENVNYVVHLKEQSILKKVLKTASKSTKKPSHNTYLNYAPTRRQSKRDIQKTPISAVQPARVIRSPQTLHADRERRDNSKRCQIIFRPNA